MYLLVNVQNKLYGTQVGGYKHGPRYTALQKFGNALENGVLNNIGMNPF